MVHVIAIVTTQPGTRSQFLDVYRANLPLVLAEQGCIAYEAVVDVPGPGFTAFGPDVFVVVERWASLADLQAHAVAPHMKAYRANVKAFHVSTVVHVLQAA